jgi:hypothetical protein
MGLWLKLLPALAVLAIAIALIALAAAPPLWS